ncbi:MAG: BON domain-containing protein [Chloroflexi bacterium]|nr:BON domain-containing protein [Chloroflexota bacterium]
MERDRDTYQDEARQDDARRRSRAVDDRGGNARERYGNEEDEYSRQYRQAYGEQDLARRMRDDRAYNRPGYEPEVGRPGGREITHLDREPGQDRQRGQYGGERGPGMRADMRADRGDDWQGGFYGQGRRFSPGEGFGRQEEESYGPPMGQRFSQDERSGGQGQRSGRTGQYNPFSRPSTPPSPYDQGDIGSWYGGDTGMGDSGSSLERPRAGSQYSSGQYSGDPYSGGQYAGMPFGSGRQGQSGGSFRQGGEQFSHGPFTGRGPRNYQRSDERIREDICEALTQHGEIDASAMEVDVRQGVVTLRGVADSGRVRRLTEEIVEEITGVQDVENQLRVNQRTGYGDPYTERQRGSTQQDAGGQHGRQGSGQTPSSSGTQQTGLQTGGTPAYGVGVAETSGVSTRSGSGEPGLSAGAGPSQHGNPWQIRDTMEVVGSDGERVGSVKTVRGTDFQLDRPMGRDLYVPFSAVQTVDGDRVMLRCRTSEVDRQNWPQPSLTGGA